MLSYDYRAGSARLDDLPDIPISPHLYVLCDRCATSLRPPRGWILDDRRSVTAPQPARKIEHVPPIETIEVPALRETEAAPDDGQRQLAFGYSA